MNDPKCNAAEAVKRAQSVVGKGGQYLLGTGDYRVKPDPKNKSKSIDLPWTQNAYGEEGSDCAGFAICWAWKLRRHRVGFNDGPWSSVVDWINCNSAYEDGLHKQELFTSLPEGAEIRAGDLVLYPTFYLKGADGEIHKFIGHVGLVEAVPAGFKYGDWRALTIIQCHGPNHYKPGVVRTDGSIWAHHDSIWPKPQHKTHVVRPKERK